MASKRAIRRKACLGKVRHDSHVSALGQIAKLRRVQGWSKLRPYRCKFCGHWHIGHY